MVATMVTGDFAVNAKGTGLNHDDQKWGNDPEVF